MANLSKLGKYLSAYYGGGTAPHTDSPSGSVIKNLLAEQRIWVRSLGGEDPLEEEMATHYSLLAWEIPWTEEPGGLQTMGSQRSQTWLSNQTTTAPHIC